MLRLIFGVLTRLVIVLLLALLEGAFWRYAIPSNPGLSIGLTFLTGIAIGCLGGFWILAWFNDNYTLVLGDDDDE